MVHTYNGILVSHKNRWNTAICNNVDRSWEYHAKQNKSDRKKVKNHVILLISGKKLKATTEQTRKANRQDL